MPANVTPWKRLVNAHPELKRRRKRSGIVIDASDLQKIDGRLSKMGEAIVQMLQDPSGFRQAVGNHGKAALQDRTREFAKNPTGALEKSWRYRSRKLASKGGRMRVGLNFTSDKPYARIHNTGGIIRPVKAKMLTIPVTGLARQVKGGPRFFPGKLFATPWGLVDLQRTTQYVWAEQVRIPETRYIDKAKQDTKEHAETLIRWRLKASARAKVSVI